MWLKGGLFLLVSSLTCSIHALSYPVCHLDPALRHLGAKAFSVRDILLSHTLQRSCFPLDAPKRRPQLSAGEVTLVYVTPWNADGYEETLLHANKVTHVSPVWFTIKLDEPKGGFKDGSKPAVFAFEGEQHVNLTWLNALPPHVKIVPRFQLQVDKGSTLKQALFFPRDEFNHIATQMVRMLEGTSSQRAMDGLVLELPASAMPFKNFIQTLSILLRKAGKRFILVVPADHALGTEPAHETGESYGITRRELQVLAPFVDLFSLVSYDHASSTGREVGNSPVRWLQRVLDKLTGIATQQSGRAAIGRGGGQDEDDLEEDEQEEEDEEEDGESGKTDKKGLDVAKKILLGLPFYGFTMTADGTLNTITKRELLSLLQFSMNSLRLNWIDQDKEHVFDMPIWRIWFTSLLGLLWRVNIARERVGGVAIWDGGQGLSVYYDVL